jgi:deoxyribonuclease-4
MYDEMLIRKKMLKIQERLGMRIGITYGMKKMPVAKSVDDVLKTLRELYKIGLKAFVLPREVFSSISTTSDLYKEHYGNLLKIKDIANKFNIELSLRHTALTDQPDETLKTFSTISSIMDCKTFIIQPKFYSMMPQDQALRLVVYKINEIVSSMRTESNIGVETTGRMREVGSLEEVIEIVKRTQKTGPVINWGHVHARGSGALSTEDDYRRVIEKVREGIGSYSMQSAFFIFPGVSYGPSGLTRYVPLSQSDMNLGHLIKQIMSFGIKGTLIFEDPDKEKFIIKLMSQLEDLVR